MKKALIIFSLFVGVQSVFSNVNNGHCRILNEILKPNGINSIANSISVDLGNNYLFTATIIKISNTAYSYVGTLTHSGTFVGTTTASFQVQTVNGVDTIVDSSFTETYSNTQTSGVVKPRHDTIKGVIQNIR